MGVIEMAEVTRLQAHWTMPVNKPTPSAIHKEKKIHLSRSRALDKLSEKAPRWDKII